MTHIHAIQKPYTFRRYEGNIATGETATVRAETETSARMKLPHSEDWRVVQNSGNRILLSRQEMETLQYAALHPDRAALKRRDRLLGEVERECALAHDGRDLVVKIPDIPLTQYGNCDAETPENI